MIRRLLAWLCPAPDLEERFAAYRTIPTGLPGEAEARRRRMPAFVARPESGPGLDHAPTSMPARQYEAYLQHRNSVRSMLGQIGPHPLRGEAVGGPSAADARRGDRSLSPVLTRPEPFADVQRVADFGAGVWR